MSSTKRWVVWEATEACGCEDVELAHMVRELLISTTNYVSSVGVQPLAWRTFCQARMPQLPQPRIPQPPCIRRAIRPLLPPRARSTRRRWQPPCPRKGSCFPNPRTGTRFPLSNHSHGTSAQIWIPQTRFPKSRRQFHPSASRSPMRTSRSRSFHPRGSPSRSFRPREDPPAVPSILADPSALDRIPLIAATINALLPHEIDGARVEGVGRRCAAAINDVLPICSTILAILPGCQSVFGSLAEAQIYVNGFPMKHHLVSHWHHLCSVETGHLLCWLLTLRTVLVRNYYLVGSSPMQWCCRNFILLQ
jgi:hypothetical protein